MAYKNKRVEERIQIGTRRIINILRKYGVGTMRMLEQKISDGGPNPQRIDPHLLTKSRLELLGRGVLLTRKEGNTQWHCLDESDKTFVEERFTELRALHSRTERREFTDRMGDTAEIAVMKAMQRNRLHFFGHFTDLNEHEDNRRYMKHDPDYFSGMAINDGKLDYILVNRDAGGMGIEIKNTREWIYPEKQIITDLLRKCLQIDVVPVLVARRIHYTTFSVLNACGAVIHQFYNQLYPYAEADLAALVRDKNKMGYSDVRVGNEPDTRMLRFFGNSIPFVAAASREKFDQRKELIDRYVNGPMNYIEFEKTLRREGDDETEDEGSDYDPDQEIFSKSSPFRSNASDPPTLFLNTYNKREEAEWPRNGERGM